MIQHWTIRNFKSIAQKTTLDLAPLTVFAGANSSGKSTVIQSILLTTQTVQNSVYSKSVILNGHISRLGAFNDILSNNFQGKAEIEIGFVLEPKSEGFFFKNKHYSHEEESIKSIDCNFIFTGKSRKAKKNELLQLQPSLESCSLIVKNDLGETEQIKIKKSKRPIDARLQQFQLNVQNLQKNDLLSLEYEIIKPSKLSESDILLNRKLPKSSKIIGATLNHFLPTRFSILYDKNQEDKRRFIELFTSPRYFEVESVRELFKKYITDELKENILQIFNEITVDKNLNRYHGVISRSKYALYLDKLKGDFSYQNLRSATRVNPLISRLFIQKFEEKKTSIIKKINVDDKPDFRIEPYFFHNKNWPDYIDFFFKNNLKYLGPLRDEPKSIYPLSNTADPKDVGFKGENTAAVLEINRNTMIKYIPSNKYETNVERKIETVSLYTAVLDWLGYMGVANIVETSDKGKLGHDLRISTSGTDNLHDLTHVGVGVSQVLPILVLSLLAGEDSVLIFEQPELHLHPRVQTRLADFFISMTELKKQCIVETHSEYLINRLRFRVAVAEGEKVSKDIIMYFVEKEEQNSKYRKITINKYGVIEDWPKGFFDENENNAANMLKASMQKRKLENEKR